MLLTHGGDVQGYRRAHGREPVLDFSANVSPLGVPPAVRRAVADAAERADRYPDPLARDLAERIASVEGVEPASVLVTNGCADAIWRFASAVRGCRAVVPRPTFSEYEAALLDYGCSVEGVSILLHKHYSCSDEARKTDRSHCGPSVQTLPAERLSQAVRPGVGAVFVCQPNNPTGELVLKADLLDLLERCEDVGARLIVDECFVGFTDDPGANSVGDLVESRPSLVVLKAFTKLWGMAGVRLGYALCSDARLLDAMRSHGAPWSVSSLAQAAGMAALDSTSYVEDVRRVVLVERPWLQRSLAALGIEARGSANFLFFSLPDDGRLGRALLDRGILVRDCSSFAGLEPGCYRIAVRTREENARLVETIAELL